MSDRQPAVFQTRLEIICLVFLCLYIMTAIPSLGWRDAPEFTVTSYTLGIAHPSGFPTYSLLTRLLAFLPLGGIAFRITCFSALAAAACLYVLGRLVYRVSLADGGEQDGLPFAVWAAAASIMVLGLSPSFWRTATSTEVYTLNVLFIIAILYAGVRWSSGTSDAWLYAGGLLYGLAAGNHGAVGLYLPGLLAYVLLHRRPGVWRRLILLIFFFLVGFSVYLYLPVRSSANPTIDWGNPETWQSFIRQISDRKDAQTHFQEVREGARFFGLAWDFVSHKTPVYFWPLGLPLVLIGVWRLLKLDWPLVVGLGFITLVNIAFFIEWRNDAFLPAVLCLAVCWAVGLAWALRKLRVPGQGLSSRSLTVIFMAVFIAAVWIQFPARDRSGSFLFMEFARDDYEAMAPEAISLVEVHWPHQRAFQDVFRLREDVTVISLSDFIQPEYFNRVTPERFPGVAVPPGPYTTENGVDYLKAFVALNLDQNRDIYWEPGKLTEVFYPYLKPELDVLLKFTREPIESLSREQVQAVFDRLRRKFLKEIEEENLLIAGRIDDYYIRSLIQLAEYLHLHHHSRNALHLLDLVEGLFGPDGQDSLRLEDRNYLDNLRGIAFLGLNRLDEAEESFKRITIRDKYYYDAWANLGMIYLKTGRMEQAKIALERAVVLEPRFPEALYSLAQYYRSLGDANQARAYYRQALKFVTKRSLARTINEELNSLPGGQGEAP